ncbi:hypothetical protein ACIQPR_44135 [Streptomyces sp. NPDC091280]|uniref:hypothetical protein n=1 Tax=Streptomyces sp. NPDC091280 TaxID=3365984 RepID=UPI003817C4FE
MALELRTTQPVPLSQAATGTPVKTREPASVGLCQELAAHQAARPEWHIDADITEAVERQARAMRALSARAFPEAEPETDSIDAARAQRCRGNER